MNCSMHFNHSLWDLDGKRNIFFDAKDTFTEKQGVQDKVSDTFKFWMGKNLTANIHKLKADRPHPCNYPYMSPDYRQTDTSHYHIIMWRCF